MEDKSLQTVFCCLLIGLCNVCDAATTYRILDLGTLGDGFAVHTYGYAISNNATVSGVSSGASGNHAFAWSPDGGMRNLGDLRGGADVSIAYSVNSCSDVVGVSEDSEGQRGFIWRMEDGIMRPIKQVGRQARLRSVNGVSDRGWMAGSADGGAAVIDAAGRKVNITSLPGWRLLVANGVSNDGSVVGAMDSTAGQHAFRWSVSTGVVDLGDLPGGLNYSEAYRINESGVAVGWSYGQPGMRAVRWSNSNSPEDLGDLPGGSDASYAYGINENGLIVGFSQTPSGERAFLWAEADGMVDLNSLIDPSDGYFGKVVLMRAYDVNDLGQITGYADFGDGIRAYLATPVALGSLPDRDGDGLLDEWEEQGYDADCDGVVDVDLPVMGADSNKKDIFVEVDWMAGAPDGHTHKPSPAVINRLIQTFAQAPISNAPYPDGISLHIDIGQLGGGNTIAEVAVLSLWKDFDAIKRANFDPKRRKIFRYAVIAHQHKLGLFGSTRESGRARSIPGSDFVVTLGGSPNQVGTEDQQVGTILHELGHTLGLHHGGCQASLTMCDETNWKTNYLSVMNYAYQFDGLVNPDPLKRFDYSRSSVADLNENSLSELDGLNGIGGDTSLAGYGARFFDGTGALVSWPEASSRVDWSGSAAIDPIPVKVDLNKDGKFNVFSRVDSDWRLLVFDGGEIGISGRKLLRPVHPSPSELEVPRSAPFERTSASKSRTKGALRSR